MTNATETGPETAAPADRPSRGLGRLWGVRNDTLLTAWLVGAIVLILIVILPNKFGRPFIGPYTSVCAQSCTIARSYVRHGIVELGGVPHQNNPPMGSQPDVYIHWPPLFWTVLGVLFGTFGESEGVAHALMLLILLANAAVLYALMANACGRRAASIAVLAMLSMPVIFKYSHLVLHLHLALLATLTSLLCFLKATTSTDRRWGWTLGGVLAVAVAVLTSWEPILAYVGLLGAALWRRRGKEIRLAGGYVLVAFLSVAGVFVLYFHDRGDLLSQMWNTIAYRTASSEFTADAGLIHSMVYTSQRGAEHASVTQLLMRYAERISVIGLLPFLAILCLAGGKVISGRRKESTPLFPIFGALLTMWFLWYVGMRNHCFYHEYQILLAVAPLSVATGIVGARLLGLAETVTTEGLRRALRALLLFVLPCLLIQGLLAAAVVESLGGEDRPYEAALVAYGRDVEKHTEPDAIVLTPIDNMLPVYYSRRHIVRGVINDQTVARAVQQAREVFPGSPIYLAILPWQEQVARFPGALRTYPRVSVSRHAIVMRIPGRPRGGVVFP